MRTNAQPKTILQAVENVSSKYHHNVIFRKTPEKLTKNVVRFTLKTKDREKAGSLISADGRMQAKANADVYKDVMAEIFKLEKKPDVFVDGHYPDQKTRTEIIETFVDHSRGRIKRKYTHNKEKGLLRLSKLITKVQEYIISHPELIVV